MLAIIVGSYNPEHLRRITFQWYDALQTNFKHTVSLIQDASAIRFALYLPFGLVQLYVFHDEPFLKLFSWIHGI